MKECKNCKTMLEDDEMFCHECGAKQETKETESQVEEQVAPEGKKCIHCGELIEADSMFCPFCGKPQAVEEEKPEEPQQESVKAEPEQSKESEPVASPQPEQVQPEEEPTIEEEEKKKSKAWLWILLVLLIAGGAGWYLYNSDSQEPVSQETPIDNETINEPNVSDLEKENEEKLEFVKDFYQHYLNEVYLKNNVDESVLNKLRRDYPYECEEGDCLATWVFSAYPPGTELELEEGPIIKQINSGTFKVEFKYSYMSGGQQFYENRSIRICVGMHNGRYKIVSYDYDEKTQAPRHDEKKLISEIPEGKYNLSCADMHVILNVHDSEVEGEYYFHGGSYMSTSVKLYGRADNGLQLHLRQWNAINEEDLGYMDGTFDGKTFKGEYDKEGYRVQFEVFVNE